MTKRERLARMAGFVVSLLPLNPGHAVAQEVTIPPDTVSTVFVTDSVPGFGAVGGVVSGALGYVYVADFRNSVWRYPPGGAVALFADGLNGASAGGARQYRRVLELAPDHPLAGARLELVTGGG